MILIAYSKLCSCPAASASVLVCSRCAQESCLSYNFCKLSFCHRLTFLASSVDECTPIGRDLFPRSTLANLCTSSVFVGFGYRGSVLCNVAEIGVVVSPKSKFYLSLSQHSIGFQQSLVFITNLYFLLSSATFDLSCSRVPSKY